MTLEKDKLLSEESIFAAELTRALGKPREAMVQTKSVLRIAPDDVTSLEEYDQKRYLTTLGIFGKSAVTEASRALTANSAHERLVRAKKPLTLYQTEPVLTLSRTIQTDTRGNPYDYATEFARHRAQHLVLCYQLTQKPAFLNLALEMMDASIEAAQDPNAQALTLFERRRLRGISFPAIESAYNEVMGTSGDNYERKATVSARFFLEAAKRGKFKKAQIGINNYKKAAERDPNVVGILTREISKKVLSSAQHVLWDALRIPWIDYSKGLDLKTE